jgi:hypothetical protein
MWVDPSMRGLGLGRRLLSALEDEAADLGSVRVRLETNRALREAIALYRSAGYREVPAFNDEPHAHHWFEKRLGPAELAPRFDATLETFAGAHDGPRRCTAPPRTLSSKQGLGQDPRPSATTVAPPRARRRFTRRHVTG